MTQTRYLICYDTSKWRLYDYPNLHIAFIAACNEYGNQYTCDYGEPTYEYTKLWYVGTSNMTDTLMRCSLDKHKDFPVYIRYIPESLFNKT